MTTTIENFRIASGSVTFQENHDLTLHLLRGGERHASCAERGIILVYLGVDDDHDEVQVHPMPAHPSVDALSRAIQQLTTVRDELRRLDG
jgi:hypothetical protein